jgi:hypothetical protein
MAQRIGTGRQRDRIPSIHKAIGGRARAAARELDCRVKLMEPRDLADALKSEPRWADEVRILRLAGDPDWTADVEEVTARVRQAISDAQPHAVSLDALADRIEAGEEVVVSPWRVIGVLAERQGVDHCRVSDLESIDGPEWLANLVQVTPPDDEDWLNVVVCAHDSVGIAPPGTVPAW